MEGFMRLNRLLSAFVVCLMVIVEIAFVYSSLLAGPSIISPTTQDVGVTTTTSMPEEGHTLQGGFWRVDGGFVSTIRIKNILVVAPIQVTPTLYMADGTAYPLVSVMVPVSGVATVNINDALKRAPQAIAAHISEFGSLMLVYKYPTPGHVVATLAAIDVPRSLSFVYMINETMVMPDDNTLKVLEGLWWRQDRGVHGTLSLSNTTDQPRTATLRVNRQPGDVDSRNVNLPPFTTQVIALEQVSREASDEKNAAGGVRVEYNGPSGAIMVSGSLANESEGYSANMPFWAQGAQTSPVRKINFGSAGIMLGKPDPMMMPGFSTETRFTPYLALRNTTNAPMDVGLLLNYMTGATPVNRSLPTQRLRAFESRNVNLGPILDQVGLRVFNGSINLGFSYMGQGGDLIVATGSVDQTGSYVFEVRPQGIGVSIGRISGYWSVDNGNDAMFSAWNPTDEPEDIMATLYYGDGSGTYHLPIHLAPQASASVDVAMLVMDKMPDIDGKIIPSNIRDGSASFDTAEKDPAAYDGKKLVTAVISGGVFNVAEATCGMVCTYCNGYNNWVIIPGPINDAIGTSSTAIAQATDSYGNKQTMSGGSWSSSNGGIMTVSNGNTQGISVGQATIADFFNSVIAIQGQYCVNESMPDNCPQGSAGPSGPGNVLPTISQDKNMWYFGNGITTPSGFTLGATNTTLHANGAGNGTYVWTITNGASRASFENNSSTMTKTNVNTIGIYSTGFSTQANDVAIQLTFTPSSGAQLTPPIYTLSIDSPYKLVGNGTTTNSGVSSCGGSSPPPGSNGYNSNVPYKIISFFGATIGNVPISELFGAVTNVISNNWGGAPPAGSLTPPAGIFVDSLCTALPPGTFNPQPKIPQSPLSSTLVQEIVQSWWVGSTTATSGVKIQSDTANYFLDHGTHFPVTSPVR
jgi:hypothetical protein